MAVTIRTTVIPNRGHAKKRPAAVRGNKRKAKAKRLLTKGHHRKATRPTGNPSEVIGLTFNKGRKPARKGASMKKKTSHAGAHAGHGSTAHRANKGKGAAQHMKHKHNAGRASHTPRKLFGMGDYVVNGLFVVAGGLGTKLITQMVLGANNVGVVGYGVNALTGAVLWFATDKTLKNPAASAGIISGTVVQIIIRLINDYTPFGQYVAQLGMGDYQAQAFLTPQVLVDPYNSARIRFPPALLAAAAAALSPAPPPPSTASKMSAAAGVSGFDPLYGGRSELYG